MFDQVQQRLAEQAPAPVLKSHGAQDAPLTGILFDEAGVAMLPTYTVKNGNKRYRYYTSRSAMKGEQSNAAIHRIPAPPLEALLTTTLQRFGLSVADQNSFSALVRRIDVLPHSIRIGLDGEPVRGAWRAAESTPATMRPRDFLVAYRDRLAAGEALSEDGSDIVLTLPIRAKFRGGAAALHAPNGALRPCPDPALLKAVARAWQWREMLVKGSAKSVEGIAARHGQDRGHVGKILGLAFLSPAIVRTIVRGEQPAGLRLTHLLNAQLPLAWDEQAVFVQQLARGIEGSKQPF